MNGLLVAFTLMTVIAAGAVLWPLFRRQQAPRRESFELGVYRDQLAEIERDQERGLIAPAEAKAARLEIERRLLRAAGSAADVPEHEQAGGRRGLVVAAAALVPLLAVMLYAGLGSPGMPDQPLAARNDRQEQDPNRPDIEQMVAQLESRLAQNPNDLEGWLMLGRSRGVLGNPQAAVEAYRRAQGLAADDPRVLAELGEGLVVAAGGVVTPEARQLFGRLLKREPADPRAAFYLGWADAQAGDNQAALERWRKLLEQTPADVPWRPRLVEAIRGAAQELNLDPETVLAKIPAPPAAPSAPQPTADDVARATAMTPEQRAEMIRGMVEKLDARMAADGSDPQGWLRLAQARAVLGETDRARAAYEKGLALHPDDPALLKGYAESLLGPARGDTGLPEIGDRAAELFAKAAALQPDDLETSWYLGVRALQEGRKDEARMRWQSVLARLKPDSPDYASVKSRLDQLGG
jgi:cytochrome c-type biogenesis protein CcmH